MKKIIGIIIVVLVAVGILIALFIDDISLIIIKIDASKIKNILESETIFQIDEINNKLFDIDLYSSNDAFGNEWIYVREKDHIVLTKDGILCKYTTGSYLKDIRYSGNKIVMKVKLSNEQIKNIADKIAELQDTTQRDKDGNIIINNTISNSKKCMIYHNDTYKSVYTTSLNRILKEYGIEM